MGAGVVARLTRDTQLRWAAPVAAALAVATFIHLGHDADAALWGLAQVVLVALAAIDLASHRLPNAITLPVAVVAVALRAGFERSSLVEVTVAGGVAFASFLILSVATRGGMGMGDVKLAGMLGFLLGKAVLPALAVGVVAGGLVSVALLAASKTTLRSTIAYGPYLAFGGSVAILFGTLPGLV